VVYSGALSSSDDQQRDGDRRHCRDDQKGRKKSSARPSGGTKVGRRRCSADNNACQEEEASSKSQKYATIEKKQVDVLDADDSENAYEVIEGESSTKIYPVLARKRKSRTDVAVEKDSVVMFPCSSSGSLSNKHEKSRKKVSTWARELKDAAHVAATETPKSVPQDSADLPELRKRKHSHSSQQRTDIDACAVNDDQHPVQAVMSEILPQTVTGDAVA
jgi:hypothetical protein